MMDSSPDPPPSSVVAGPSTLWQLAMNRNRKAGSGNIFSSVKLWQLQRLFQVAGDQDAEQRAQLVWGHGDEAELTKALMGLKAQRRRRGLRSHGRDPLCSHWLQAFNHLRIGEASLSSQGKKNLVGESDLEVGAEPLPETSSTEVLAERQCPAGTSQRPGRDGPGLKRGGGGGGGGGGEHDPDRYLHRILH